MQVHLKSRLQQKWVDQGLKIKIFQQKKNYELLSLKIHQEVGYNTSIFFV